MLDTQSHEVDSKPIPPEFWEENVSKSHGKHNLPPALWDKICKIRSRPVELRRTEILGSTSKPHTVLPQGCKGYIFDYPEAFVLDDQEIESIRCCPPDMVPVTIKGYEGIVFFDLKQLKVIPPYFDMSLADLAYMEVKNGGV